MLYSKMSPQELKNEYDLIKSKWLELKEMGLSLDMSRGKPEKRQLDLCMDLMNCLKNDEDCKNEDGFDVRNYGLPTGLPELKRIFSDLMGVGANEIFVGGNSSLKLMYNIIVDAMLIGLPGSEKPWSKYDKIRFLCPAPGYDRHFSMCEHLGIEMITIPMLSTGPDMDMIEKLVAEDETIKGVWCVPKYSNPTGITFSDETVKRFAALKPKASDFRIFWDNAYMIHDLTDTPDELLNIHHEAKKQGNESIVFEFCSTSKITLAGAGICFVASSAENINWIISSFQYEGLGYDKVNQLRHARYIKNVDNLFKIMKQHAAIIAPKFDVVITTFEKEFGDSGIASWYKPNGGYFISLDVAEGTAKRTWDLANQMGVTLTGAGSTFPYRKDPKDSNLRIAPSNVDHNKVSEICEYIVICAKLASLEKLIGIRS